jgi:hypothetical protein
METPAAARASAELACRVNRLQRRGMRAAHDLQTDGSRVCTSITACCSAHGMTGKVLLPDDLAVNIDR